MVTDGADRDRGPLEGMEIDGEMTATGKGINRDRGRGQLSMSVMINVGRLHGEFHRVFPYLYSISAVIQDNG